MPSRRAVLALCSTALAGCASAPALSVPSVDDQPCPPVDSRVDRAVCSHTDDDGGVDVRVSPTTVSTDPESLEAVSIRIENGLDVPLEYAANRWRLFRDAGYGWQTREFDPPPRNVEQIPPGGAHVWASPDVLFELGYDGPTPAGAYAAVLPVQAGDEGIACVALFRVAD